MATATGGSQRKSEDHSIWLTTFWEIQKLMERRRVLVDRVYWQKGKIRREATNSSKGHRSIQRVGITCSPSSVLRAIKSSPNLVRRKAKRCVVNKRIQGGGGIIIWGTFSPFGTAKLALVRGRMDSRRYQEILRDHLPPYIHRWPNIEFLFVQDNAPIHVSRSTREWFDAQMCTFFHGHLFSVIVTQLKTCGGTWAALFMQMENNLTRLKLSHMQLFVLWMPFLNPDLKTSSILCQTDLLKW